MSYCESHCVYFDSWTIFPNGVGIGGSALMRLYDSLYLRLTGWAYGIRAGAVISFVFHMLGIQAPETK